LSKLIFWMSAREVRSGGPQRGRGSREVGVSQPHKQDRLGAPHTKDERKWGDRAGRRGEERHLHASRLCLLPFVNKTRPGPRASAPPDRTRDPKTPEECRRDPAAPCWAQWWLRRPTWKQKWFGRSSEHMSTSSLRSVTPKCFNVNTDVSWLVCCEQANFRCA